jgi:hypothetical protein
MLWNLINTVIASIGIGLAIWGITYRRRQFELLKQQDANTKKQATEDEEWAAKFGLAAKNLIKMSRNYVNIGASQGFAYHFFFPDPEFRNRIESFLIQREQTMDIQIRTLSPDQLRLPHVRSAITDVLRAVEKMKRDSPFLAEKLGIV